MAKPTKRLSLEQARAKYVHRYTMEHVPQWSRQRAPGGKFYAPQYRNDQEWYEHTIFPGERDYPFRGERMGCYTTGQTWPLGLWLDTPYQGPGGQE